MNFFKLKILFFLISLQFFSILYNSKSSQLEFVFLTAATKCNICTINALNFTIKQLNESFSSPKIKVYVTKVLKPMMKKHKYPSNVEILDASLCKNYKNETNIVLIRDKEGLILTSLDDFQRKSILQLLKSSSLIYIDTLINLSICVDNIEDKISQISDISTYNGSLDNYQNSKAFLDRNLNMIFILDTAKKEIIKEISLPDTLTFYYLVNPKNRDREKDFKEFVESGISTAFWGKIFSFTDSTLDILASVISDSKIYFDYDDTVKDTVKFIEYIKSFVRFNYNVYNDKVSNIRNFGDKIYEYVSPNLNQNKIFYFSYDFLVYGGAFSVDSNEKIKSITIIESINLNNGVIEHYLPISKFLEYSNLERFDSSEEEQFPLILATEDRILVNLASTSLILIDHNSKLIKKMEIPEYLKVERNIDKFNDLLSNCNETILNKEYRFRRNIYKISGGFIYIIKLTSNSHVPYIWDYIIIGIYDDKGNLIENKIVNFKNIGKIKSLRLVNANNGNLSFIAILNDKQIIKFNLKLKG